MRNIKYFKNKTEANKWAKLVSGRVVKCTHQDGYAVSWHAGDIVRDGVRYFETNSGQILELAEEDYQRLVAAVDSGKNKPHRGFRSDLPARELALTYAGRKKSHDELRAGGYTPDEQSIMEQYDKIIFLEQCRRAFEDRPCSYDEGKFIMRYFGGHIMSPGIEAELMRVKTTPISDFRDEAMTLAKKWDREQWESQAAPLAETACQYYGLKK